jgi:chaperonin GroES
MKFRPLGDRVIVEREELEKQSTGGIIMPDSLLARGKSQRGKVIAVGTGRLLENGKHGDMFVTTNQRVLFGAYAGNEVELEGKEYLILRQEDILAVLD